MRAGGEWSLGYWILMRRAYDYVPEAVQRILEFYGKPLLIVIARSLDSLQGYTVSSI